MYDFPRWIVADDGTVFYLTDEDMRDHDLPYQDANHSTIFEVFRMSKRGTHGEGFPCPPVIALEINRGKMQNIIEAYGCKSVKLNINGELHCEGYPALEFFDTGKDWWFDGRKEWWVNGKRHREDGPAFIRSDVREWFLNGKRHRLDGPAIEWTNGCKSWYVDGKNHRVDGPAIEFPGYEVWYFDGKYHRSDGPAIEWSNGYKEWWSQGERHKEDGPAVEWADGTKEWWLNDDLHREDGPAIDRADGSKEWWIHGKPIRSEKLGEAASDV